MIGFASGISSSTAWSRDSSRSACARPCAKGRPAGSKGRRFTHIDIDGAPTVSVNLELDGGQLPGGDATATRAINAIKAVCNATPTVHSALDLVVTPQGAQTIKQGELA